MAITPDQLQQTIENVITEVNSVADTATGILTGVNPAWGASAAAFLAIGKAVDKLIPGMAASVDRWIQGNLPTDAEKADFALKISVLSDKSAP